MTLFAVSIAGLFPILHLGRPQYVYWLAPYPNTMALWPQWRSALVWDFWAIVSYLLFSILFLYIGLIPDLATMRDRARSPPGAVALRRVRARLARLGPALAAATRPCTSRWRRSAVPLVVSVHSIVGLDFAASLMPGWQESIFPPYFVVGAMYSGFAMVVMLTALVRWGSASRRSSRSIISTPWPRSCCWPRSSWAFPTRPSGSWPGTAAQPAERCLVVVRVHRRLRAALLDHARLQLRAAAGAVVPARPTQHLGGRR